MGHSSADAGGEQGGDAEEEYDPEEPQAVQPVRPAPEPEEYQPIEDDVEDWGGHTRHGGSTFGTANLRADPQREQCPSAAPVGASDSLAYLRTALAKPSPDLLCNCGHAVHDSIVLQTLLPMDDTTTQVEGAASCDMSGHAVHESPSQAAGVCLGSDEAQEVGEGEEDEIEAMFKKKKKRRVLDHMEKRKIVDNLLAQVPERC